MPRRYVALCFAGYPRGAPGRSIEALARAAEFGFGRRSGSGTVAERHEIEGGNVITKDAWKWPNRQVGLCDSRSMRLALGS